MAEMFFKRECCPQEMEIQGEEYTVIGVVREFSTYAIRADGIWIPHVFTSFFALVGLGITIWCLFPRMSPSKI